MKRQHKDKMKGFRDSTELRKVENKLISYITTGRAFNNDGEFNSEYLKLTRIEKKLRRLYI